jgi:hypothetical protein
MTGQDRDAMLTTINGRKVKVRARSFIAAGWDRVEQIIVDGREQWPIGMTVDVSSPVEKIVGRVTATWVDSDSTYIRIVVDRSNSSSRLQPN